MSKKNKVPFRKYVLEETVKQWNERLGKKERPWHKAPRCWQKAAYDDKYITLWGLIKDGELQLPENIELPAEYEENAFNELFPAVYTGARKVLSLDDLLKTGEITYWTDWAGNAGKLPYPGAPVEDMPEPFLELYRNYWVDWLGVPLTTFVVTVNGKNGIMLSFKVNYPNELLNQQDKLSIGLGYEVLKTKAEALANHMRLYAPAGVDILFGADTIQDAYEVALFFEEDVCSQMLGVGCYDATSDIEGIMGKLNAIEAEMLRLVEA